MNSIFSTYSLAKRNIKNRIVFPPVVSFSWAVDDGTVTDLHVNHYERVARGDVGLIIVEATCVNNDGRVNKSQLGIWSEEHIEGLSKITRACHKYDAVVLLQIHHSGLTTNENVAEKAFGPSILPDNPRSQELTIEQIKKLQDDFIYAAVRAQIAEFDGVELHGAHSFLLNQFANLNVNRRSDEYGKTIKGSLKFAEEIIKGIKSKTSKDFILGYRLGANSPTLDEGIIIANELESFGIDLLHVSHGGSFGIIPEKPIHFNYNWIVYSGTIIKNLVNVPVIVVNEIKTPERADFLIKNNMADFVAIGRDLLTDPNWIQKAKNNENINYCIQCKPKCKRYESPEHCPFSKAKK